MIIIFEGFEKVGKTTIAKKLASEISVPYFKNPNELQNTLFEKEQIDFEVQTKHDWRYMIEFLKQTKNSAIFDRSFISEFAYGKIFRSKNYEKNNVEKFIKHYDDELGKINSFLIYCFKNHNNEEDDIINKSFATNIDCLYRQYIEQTKIRTIIINTEDHNIERQIKMIRSKMNV